MESEHHFANLRVHNSHACYPQEKRPIVCRAIQGRERSISATEQFQRKCHKFFDLRRPLSTWQRFQDEETLLR